MKFEHGIHLTSQVARDRSTTRKLTGKLVVIEVEVGKLRQQIDLTGYT